jgi:hypothetical protein
MINLETKNWNNFYLGLAVAILPFIGIPLAIKKPLFLVFGLLIALFSLARLSRRSEKLPATPLATNNETTA